MLKSAANYSNSRGHSPTEPENLAPRPPQQNLVHSAGGARCRAGLHGRPNFPEILAARSMSSTRQENEEFGGEKMAIDLFLPRSIILNHGGVHNVELTSYKEADRCLQDLATMLGENAHLSVHVIIIFEDAFVWNSNIIITISDCIADSFLQRAMQSEWEFNAGVRPKWWPPGIESDRMWEVHCREDRHNGRSELARGRLDRYDLRPVIRNPLPPRYLPD
jgi:hypothetical protein